MRWRGGQAIQAGARREAVTRISGKTRHPKQVFPKVAAGFGSKNLLDKGS
jgi:hypothetical protein